MERLYKDGDTQPILVREPLVDRTQVIPVSDTYQYRRSRAALPPEAAQQLFDEFYGVKQPPVARRIPVISTGPLIWLREHHFSKAARFGVFLPVAAFYFMTLLANLLQLAAGESTHYLNYLEATPSNSFNAAWVVLLCAVDALGVYSAVQVAYRGRMNVVNMVSFTAPFLFWVVCGVHPLAAAQ